LSCSWRGQEVAIKKLKSQKLDAQILKRFYVEASILNELNPAAENIVTIYAMCVTPPNLSIITSFHPLGCLVDNWSLVK
jgi:hypothetical protein